MLDKLYATLREVEEAIEYAEACDHAYTRYYTSLCKARKSLLKTIKKFENAERNKCK
ncbi:MAG: hypothetical protein IJV73_06015 [Clostridia bacterium]|nr:hypothetical protein [Clostridia bacterium]